MRHRIIPSALRRASFSAELSAAYLIGTLTRRKRKVVGGISSGEYYQSLILSSCKEQKNIHPAGKISCMKTWLYFSRYDLVANNEGNEERGGGKLAKGARQNNERGNRKTDLLIHMLVGHAVSRGATENCHPNKGQEKMLVDVESSQEKGEYACRCGVQPRERGIMLVDMESKRNGVIPKTSNSVTKKKVRALPKKSNSASKKKIR